MATYEDIQSEVKVSAGFVPQTCWIAHILELLGAKPRRAANRIDPAKRQHPCPPEKMSATIAALYKLGRVSTARDAGLRKVS